jgi:hypothetical protein
LTAFQLSDELKRLKMMESQFCAEYNELRCQVSKKNFHFAPLFVQMFSKDKKAGHAK